MDNKYIDYPIFSLIFYLRKKLFYTDLKIFQIKDLSECLGKRVEILNNAEMFQSTGIKTLKKSAETKSIKINELILYNFKNTLVNINSSAIISNEELVVERNFKFERYNEGYINFHGFKRALVKMQSTIDVEEAFFLGGNGCWNWYHFLVEIAPKLLFINKIPCKNILVSDSVLKYEGMKKVISHFLNQNYNIIYSNPENNYKVKNLYYINNISYVPYNLMKPSILFGIENVYMRKDILIKLRKQLLDKVSNLIDLDYPKKILIKRKKNRIAKNQKQLTDFLKNNGFKEIIFEDLSLEEQIKHIYNADYVVGASGAAWANLIFSKPGLKGICFMQDNFPTFCCFSNIAKLFDVNLIYSLYSTKYSPNEHDKDGYILDIQAIKNIYLKLEYE
ncbi:glycosyltransferase family 61 protein [Apibacter muscae]|uniref:glycosyltransferase family 61 protein n=1 Tax=Apibacter muscae TaxID=2509004 RepID=UPI001624A34E|nr:glycosyltransferase family 61 protein [Apibacter muscae]